MINFNKKKPQPDVSFDPRKKAFLVAFARCGMVIESAKLAGVSAMRVAKWKNTDIHFAKKFQVAQLAFLERLESEADRRALKGVEEPIYNRKGELVGKKIKYSDTLLMFRMKALAPQKYREKDVEIPNEQIDHAIERLLKLAGVAGGSQAKIASPVGGTDGGDGNEGPQGPIVGEVLPP